MEINTVKEVSSWKGKREMGKCRVPRKCRDEVRHLSIRGSLGLSNKDTVEGDRRTVLENGRECAGVMYGLCAGPKFPVVLPIPVLTRGSFSLSQTHVATGRTSDYVDPCPSVLLLFLRINEKFWGRVYRGERISDWGRPKGNKGQCLLILT